MSGIKLKIFELGPLHVNCYLMYSVETKHAILIDAPEGVGQVVEFIEKERLAVECVLITHGHFDHISGLTDLHYPFYVHSEDAPALKDSRKNGSAYFSHPVVILQAPGLLDENTLFSFEGRPFKFLHTPGHTPGSVSILYESWLFSGDTIFFDSIGRTDVPLGNQEHLIASIKEKILTLPGDTIIYPGHGPSSTVKREKKSNPYLS
jgi:hydroxyacylglutathione hydrolase